MRSISITFVLILITCLTTAAQDAKSIVQKAYDKMQGESSYAEMEMKVIRPSWDRTIRFKSWTKGTKYSLTLITYPAKEKGKTFLKRGNEMWNYSPTINRMIKLPPSMMSQGWMGSDYTNDDMMNEASVIIDYHHKLLGTETIDGYTCYKIELKPKEEAAVVWGKIMMWISKEDYYELKTLFYDEDEDLIKTHRASEIKFMYDRKIPSKFEIIPKDEEKQKTEVYIKEIKFDIQLNDDFFSQQNMKKIR
jgi:outer membrane lipoprotein-sorting protein